MLFIGVGDLLRPWTRVGIAVSLVSRFRCSWCVIYLSITSVLDEDILPKVVLLEDASDVVGFDVNLELMVGLFAVV